jgi:hypothetical protein
MDDPNRVLRVNGRKIVVGRAIVTLIDGRWIAIAGMGSGRVVGVAIAPAGGPERCSRR